MRLYDFLRVYLLGLDGIKASKTVEVETNFKKRSFELRIFNLDGKNYR